MSTALTLNVHDHPANSAENAIVARLAAFQDAGGKVLLKGLKAPAKGIALPNAQHTGLMILPENTPTVRVVSGGEQSVVEGQSYVDGPGVTRISLFCYLYIAPDKEGRFPDGQALIRNFTRWVRRALWHTASDNPQGFVPDHTKWQFRPQIVSIDTVTALRDYTSEPVLPPWYIAKIDLEIETWDANVAI